jgi:hypothetical protein
MTPVTFVTAMEAAVTIAWAYQTAHRFTMFVMFAMVTAQPARPVQIALVYKAAHRFTMFVTFVTVTAPLAFLQIALAYRAAHPFMMFVTFVTVMALHVQIVKACKAARLPMMCATSAAVTVCHV